MNGYQAVSQMECTKQIKRLRGYDIKQARVGKTRCNIFIEAKKDGEE